MQCHAEGNAMKAEKYNYICSGCRHHFHANELGRDFRCGEFLLRSEGLDNERFLNASGDEVFNELSTMVDCNYLLKDKKDKKDIERAKIFQAVFGITCDPDEDGSLFQINIKPRCPSCGKREMDWWDESKPLVIVDINIPHVTHYIWNLKTRKEKEDLLNKVLKKSMDLVSVKW